MDQARKKLSEREVEAEYGIPAKTLQAWRFQRKGPPYQKLAGTIVKYDRASLDAWFDNCAVRHPNDNSYNSRGGDVPTVAHMTDEMLIGELARQIMCWKVAPDRFLKGGRSWIPRWRFRPTERLEDAFTVLEQAAPQYYRMGAVRNEAFSVTICIRGKVGEAKDESKPRAISLALARSLGLEA
jgi:hypothetical protein